MLVRSQDKEILADISEFSTIKVFGSETKRFCIMGKIINTNDEIPLGFYASMEEVTEELNNIELYRTKNSKDIYEIN